LQHMGTELQQADTKPKAACGRDLFDESVGG